jgi:hypothetical protein
MSPRAQEAVSPRQAPNFRLVEVGRSKWTGDVRAMTSRELLSQVGRHLMTDSFWIGEDGKVLVGGVRTVGRVEPLHDIARAMFLRWVGKTRRKGGPKKTGPGPTGSSKR